MEEICSYICLSPLIYYFQSLMFFFFNLILNSQTYFIFSFFSYFVIMHFNRLLSQFVIEYLATFYFHLPNTWQLYHFVDSFKICYLNTSLPSIPFHSNFHTCLCLPVILPWLCYCVVFVRIHRFYYYRVE